MGLRKEIQAASKVSELPTDLRAHQFCLTVPQSGFLSRSGALVRLPICQSGHCPIEEISPGAGLRGNFRGIGD